MIFGEDSPIIKDAELFSQKLMKRSLEKTARQITSQKENITELKEELESLVLELENIGTDDDPIHVKWKELKQELAEMGTEDDRLHEELERLNKILEELKAEIANPPQNEEEEEAKENRELRQKNTEEQILKVQGESEEKRADLEKRISEVEEESEEKRASLGKQISKVEGKIDKKEKKVEFKELEIPEDDNAKLESRLEKIKILKRRKLSRKEKRNLGKIKEETQEKIILRQVADKDSEIEKLVETRDSFDSRAKTAENHEEKDKDWQALTEEVTDMPTEWMAVEEEVIKAQRKISETVFLTQDQVYLLRRDIKTIEGRSVREFTDEQEEMNDIILDTLEEDLAHKLILIKAHQRQFPELTNSPRTEGQRLEFRIRELYRTLYNLNRRLIGMEDLERSGEKEKEVSKKRPIGERFRLYFEGETLSKLPRETKKIKAPRKFNETEMERQKVDFKERITNIEKQIEALEEQQDGEAKLESKMPMADAEFIMKLMEAAAKEYEARHPDTTV